MRIFITAPLWLTHLAEQVVPAANLSLPEFTTEACSLDCSLAPWCKTFVVQRSPSDQVSHWICHLYDQSRAQLAAKNQLTVGDTAFELHEPLTYTAYKRDNQGGHATAFATSPLKKTPRDVSPVAFIYSGTSGNSMFVMSVHG
jgi:hypothetical protein